MKCKDGDIRDNVDMDIILVVSLFGSTWAKD